MDNQGNILKLSFLISYLALLICVVGGLPFMTAVFRSVILMSVFALIGYAFRWYLLHLVSSVLPDEPEQLMGDEQDEEDNELDSIDSEMDQEPTPAAGEMEMPQEAAGNVNQADEQS